MKALLRAEAMKLWVTPSLRYALLAAPAVSLSAVGLAVFFRDPQASDALGVFESAYAGRVAALVLGVLLLGGEFQHGTISSLLADHPRRVRVILAKAGTACAAGAIAAGLSIAAGFGVGAAALATQSAELNISAGQLAVLAGEQAIGFILWGLAGVGLGALTASQSGGLLLGFGGLLAFAFLAGSDVAPFLPSGASDALIGDGAPSSLAPVPSGLVLCAWATGLLTAGAALFIRRDIA